MSWHNNPNAHTGYCTTEEGVVAIKWRNLGDQRDLPQSDAQKVDLGTDHMGTPENPNYLPNEAIRIYTIEPTSENARLYNYPAGRIQPRANEDEVRYLNEYITSSGEKPWKDFKVDIGSRLSNKDENDPEQLQAFFPLRPSNAEHQSLTRNPRVMSRSTYVQDPKVWTADSKGFLYEANEEVSQARFHAFHWKGDQTATRYIYPSSIDSRFTGHAKEMVIETNTASLIPRGGIKPNDTIFNISIPTEPSENQTLPFGKGATVKIYDDNQTEGEADLSRPTNLSIVNLRWARAIPDTDPRVAPSCRSWTIDPNFQSFYTSTTTY